MPAVSYGREPFAVPSAHGLQLTADELLRGAVVVIGSCSVLTLLGYFVAPVLFVAIDLWIKRPSPSGPEVDRARLQTPPRIAAVAASAAVALVVWSPSVYLSAPANPLENVIWSRSGGTLEGADNDGLLLVSLGERTFHLRADLAVDRAAYRTLFPDRPP